MKYLSSFEKKPFLVKAGYVLLALFYTLVILSIRFEGLREAPGLIPGILSVVCFVIAGIIYSREKVISQMLWSILGGHVLLSLVIYFIAYLILGNEENGILAFFGKIEAASIGVVLLLTAGSLLLGAIALRIMSTMAIKQEHPVNK